MDVFVCIINFRHSLNRPVVAILKAPKSSRDLVVGVLYKINESFYAICTLNNETHYEFDYGNDKKVRRSHNDGLNQCGSPNVQIGFLEKHAAPAINEKL